MGKAKLPYSFYFALLIVFFFPTWAYAASPDPGFVSQIDDRSLYYLGKIFGPVSSVLPFAEGSAFFSYVFRIFNTIVLSFSTIILTYVTIMSLVNTAQEGQMMGQKWSSMWIPFRSAIGLSFLIPLPSGYNLIQIMVMWLIVQGVHLGNQLWYRVLDYYQAGYSINQPTPRHSINFPDANFFQELFRIAVCQSWINHQGLLGARLDDPDSYARAHIDTLQLTGRENSIRIHFGIPDTAHRDVCGYLTLPKPNLPNAHTLSVQTIQRYYEQVAFAISSVVDNQLGAPAFEAVDSPTGPASYRDIFNTAENTLRSMISAVKSTLDLEIAQNVNPDGAVQRVVESGRQNGWILAGAFYNTLIASRTMATLAPFRERPISPSARPTQADIPVNPYLNDYMPFHDAYVEKMEGRANNVEALSNFRLPPSHRVGFSEFYEQTIGAPFRGLADTIMRDMMDTIPPEGQRVDPILSLQDFGKRILNALEWTVLTYVLLCFLVPLILGIAPGFSGIPWAFASMTSFVGGILSFLISILVVPGVLFAMYLPMAPFLLFTFGALSWFILCIEAMISAPIAALGLTLPAQEGLGRAAGAVTILLNLFLRPALMILGFVAASRLLIVIFDLFINTFVPTMMSIGSMGIFSFIAVCFFYSGICSILAHECWSLIHIIPDRTIRWIGGQPEQSSIGRSADEVEASHQTTAATAQGIGTSIVDKASEIAKRNPGTGPKQQQMQAQENEPSEENNGTKSGDEEMGASLDPGSQAGVQGVEGKRKGDPGNSTVPTDAGSGGDGGAAGGGAALGGGGAPPV